MKKTISISMIFIFLVGCENAQKSNGFVKDVEGSSWQMGTQASVDLVVELDKYWGVDYDKMRTFFVDTLKSRFEGGQSYETLDGFIGQVKESMEENSGSQYWSMEGAFSVDRDPTKGGDWVNAWFMVDATDSQPKRLIVEYYYVKNGKIHQFSQSKQIREKQQLEANLEMYERVWHNAINNDDWTDVNEDNFDKNVTLVLQPENVVGVQGVKDYYKNYVTGFSDRSFTIVDLIGQGDKIVKHWNFKGTHTGNFFGIPPTGRKLDLSGVTLVKMKDGKIVQEHDIFDNLSFLKQLGLPTD